MVWPAVIAAGAVLGSALLSRAGASDANEQARENMFAQQEFQERMSSTAYQRATADMRAAGLNPILAYKQGGASSPAGSAAPVVNELEGAASSAMQARMIGLEMDQLEASTDAKKAEPPLIRAQTERTRSEKELADQNFRTSSANEAVARAQEYLTYQDTARRAWEVLSAKEMAGTAAAERRIRTREAQDVERYGTSGLGRSVGSLERMFETFGRRANRDLGEKADAWKSGGHELSAAQERILNMIRRWF